MQVTTIRTSPARATFCAVAHTVGEIVHTLCGRTIKRQRMPIVVGSPTCRDCKRLVSKCQRKGFNLATEVA